MAIRDWSPRQIKRMWVIAAGIQLALLALWIVPHLRGYRPVAPPPERGASIFARLDSAAEAEYLARLRDSLGLDLTVSGDTVRAIQLVPGGRADSLAKSVGAAFREITPALVVIAILFWVVYLSPTWIAAWITMLWWRHRRLAGAAPAPGDV